MQGVFFIAACASVLAVAPHLYLLICKWDSLQCERSALWTSLRRDLASGQPNNDVYGILPMIVGSLYVTAGALSSSECRSGS